VDTTELRGATAGVTVDLFNEYAEGGGGADGLYGFENVTGSAFDDWIGGTDANNVLAGANGDDTVDYSAAAAGVSVDLDVAVAQNTGGAGTDTLTGFENLSGSTFADTLRGTAGDNWFMAGRATTRSTVVPVRHGRLHGGSAAVVVDLLAGTPRAADGTTTWRTSRTRSGRPSTTRSAQRRRQRARRRRRHRHRQLPAGGRRGHRRPGVGRRDRLRTDLLSGSRTSRAARSPTPSTATTARTRSRVPPATTP